MYNLSGLEVPQDLEIVITTPAYFERLGLLLQNTDPEYVATIIIILCMVYLIRLLLVMQLTGIILFFQPHACGFKSYDFREGLPCT